VIVPQGTINVSNKVGKSQCQGYILMAPSHTSLAHTPSHALPKGTEGGRWSNCVQVGRNKQSDETNLTGRILLFSDTGQCIDTSKGDVTENRSDPDETEVIQSLSQELKLDCSVNASSVKTEDAVTNTNPASLEERTATHCHLSYGSASIRGRGANFKASTADNPKRGDLVSFARGKGGKVRDVCVMKPNAATTITGALVNVDINAGTASFVPSVDKDNHYQIILAEVVSCETALLKENEMVEGILYCGKIFGICRTADLYLKSTVRSGLKERPRLNLTVKRELKDRGGKIIAQSGMAKGPDGTIGFALGWTTRSCTYSQIEEESILDINSREFYPEAAVTTKTIDESELKSEHLL